MKKKTGHKGRKRQRERERQLNTRKGPKRDIEAKRGFLSSGFNAPSTGERKLESQVCSILFITCTSRGTF